MQFDIKNEEHRRRLHYEQIFYSAAVDYRDARKFLYIPENYVTDGGFELGKVWSDLQEIGRAHV